MLRLRTTDADRTQNSRLPIFLALNNLSCYVSNNLLRIQIKIENFVTDMIQKAHNFQIGAGLTQMFLPQTGETKLFQVQVYLKQTKHLYQKHLCR